ncbi:hypothetical protein JKF63_04727 [Porcisia hertigi]|uniref:Uncharacterized protein n=1 Tax=Porcisia hertigi TaxID=2761500 RepID=A0A836L8Y2_9TRYP|nr:hypothetical protein JKF63_04727 [Porcisia hertigi]
MDIDQHTTATISEIDRTLRSLGIRDEYPATLFQSSINSNLPTAVCAPVTRANGATQTCCSTYVNAGVQKSPATVSQGVQHSQQQRATFSQTEKGLDELDSLRTVVNSVLCVNSILEDRLQTLQCSSVKIEALFLKLIRLEAKANATVKSFHSLQKRCVMQTIEIEEMSSRSSLLGYECNVRTELMSLRCGELACLLAASGKKQVLPNSSGGVKRLASTRAISNASALKETPSSSLNDLTELLDECRRALDG